MKFTAIAAVAMFIFAGGDSSPRTTLPVTLQSARDDRSPNLPLLVDGASNVVVMEYEAWFGPNAVTFPALSLTPRPLLSSADMRPVGGGYDSEDPNVIRTHIGLLTSIGVDAITLDLTNNVSCIFDTGHDALSPALLNPCGQSTAARNRRFQSSMQQIAANDANIYTAWSALGTSLKIIPLLACQDNGCLTPYNDAGRVAGFGIDPCPAIPGVPVGNLHGNPAVDGTTSFEKELAFFDVLMTKYRNLSVIYEGKPLVLVFAPPGIDDDPCMMQRLRKLIVRTGLTSKYTFRMIGGFFDADRTFWNEPPGYAPTAPVPLERGFGEIWWSVDDRLNEKFGYYPSFNMSPSYNRVENFTASLAVMGHNGWGTWPAPCPPAPPTNPPVTTCPKGTRHYVDTSLRNEGGIAHATLANFMSYAGKLDPIFLIVDQYNEFALPDEGWDADTTDDIEPADGGIGYDAVDAVRSFIARYRSSRKQASVTR
ncbi:MAG: hypothetical protein IAI50_08390 [Candidatus Eremiobacteraeota bacterium]|nr:hypothetical protein [Candidatus Eremiobacteraeota bacterium]